MPILAIYNPVSGDGTAKAFFHDHVIPLLEQRGKAVERIAATEHAGHAGEILVDFLESVQGETTVVLGSGDGTLHEIINFLSSVTLKGSNLETPLPRLSFVLVPCGTANALYNSLFPPDGDGTSLDTVEYRLKSVHSFLQSAHTIPLTLAIATLSSAPSVHKRPSVAIAAVVVSTSLHASILHDSESLREQIPGVERFKVAARNNSTKWYNSFVTLLPAPATGRVQIYDPATKVFVDHPDSNEADPIVDLDGPFAYFLSTVNVDRLEPTFRIAPIAIKIPPVDASCDLVIVRPLRDPSIAWDNPEVREAYVPKLWNVLGAAYQDGAHVDLRYNSSGQVVTSGEGVTVVEYIRCGGWEWIPDEEDEGAHLLCSDGAIFHIEKGGRVVCSAATPRENAGFAVYA
ncbi:Sphingoid long chain base kinase 4 [Hypsizygus marmoreus]|uniref:Sphingoid long chain base kinase 4 n=1 Tax=Hypsizygus marmoreus TaxID=39966 RepID=A0A369JP82_HYPMA|nr:Sphingoid long chain base kinase 4 [Hypsizygus marmoreus]